MVADLSQLVKAYDVRGVVPDQWDESLAELFGAAFVQVTRAAAIVIVSSGVGAPPRGLMRIDSCTLLSRP